MLHGYPEKRPETAPGRVDLGEVPAIEQSVEELLCQVLGFAAVFRTRPDAGKHRAPVGTAQGFQRLPGLGG